MGCNMDDEQVRLEVNVKRLLEKCELIAKEDAHKGWRLEKYVQSLDEMVLELQKLQSSSKPSETMKDYVKQVEFLKGIVSSGKLANPIERAAAAQMLSKSSTNESLGSNITTQIHQKTTAKFNKELRSELFYSKKESSDGELRKRLSNNPSQDEDLNALLKYNRNIQEKIAENMLSMTSSMKEQALTANAIIKRDMGFLDKSDKLTDVNATKLKSESLKLEEHTKSNWRCWLWLMVAVVLVIFFNMIFFMKVAKKKVVT